MWNRIVKTVALSGWTLVVAGCGGAEAPPAAATPAAAPAPSAPMSVSFVSPKNGDTIKSMSTFEFASTGTTVGAVPPGDLTPDQVRAGIIHYHLGVDTECLEAGVLIPKADPWIHFGDGKNVIEMSLAPGAHKLAVQAGDDMHRTLPGMCEVINVTVAQ